MYPILLLSKEINIFPILGNQTNGNPAFLDYSIQEFTSINPRNQDEIEIYNKSLLVKQNSSWAIGGYLEDRSHILIGTHIREEWRIFHLWVDIIFPAGTKLHSPLDGKIYEKWYEPWDGNYWGYIIIEHCINDSSFFILYGHLSYNSITNKEIITGWEQFATLGGKSENGNWFEHLHLQVFTGKDLEKWKNKGYCSANDLLVIRNYCPDPMFIFRY